MEEKTNTFEEYESFLESFEEKSNFQKQGEPITKMLKQEIHLIDLQKQNRATKLHKYQIEAVLKTAHHFHPNNEAKNRPVLITAPSGSGKSGMVVLLPYVLLSKKVLIVTPSEILSNQIAQEFGSPNQNNAFFLKCGILKSTQSWENFKREIPWIPRNPEDMKVIDRHNLVILNVQKLLGNSTKSLNSKNSGNNSEIRKMLSDFDTLIADEAHHYSLKTWQNILECFRGKKIIFLTATPFRNVGNKIVHMADASFGLDLDEIYSIQKELLEGVTIRKLEFIEKRMAFNFDELTWLETIKALSTSIQDIFDENKNIEPRLKNPQAIIAVRTKIEAQKVASGLGNAATYVFSGKEGLANLSEFDKGKKQIAVVCGMLKEGYDNSNVILCVMLHRCQSRVIFEQFCGRCRRINQTLSGNSIDKTVGIILSFENFQLKKLWDTREVIADEDITDETEKKEEEEAKQMEKGTRQKIVKGDPMETCEPKIMETASICDTSTHLDCSIGYASSSVDPYKIKKIEEQISGPLSLEKTGDIKRNQEQDRVQKNFKSDLIERIGNKITQETLIGASTELAKFTNDSFVSELLKEKYPFLHKFLYETIQPEKN